MIIELCKLESFTIEYKLELLELLPEKLVQEIKSAKKEPDQNRRLIARLLLLRNIINSGKPVGLINQIQVSEHNKPFIEGWKHFNISHSDNWVAIAIDECEVGIDIQVHKDAKLNAISKYFHDEERHVLAQEDFKNTSFYKIWTRKEALLKGIGIGFTEGLDKINSLEDKLIYQNTAWNISSNSDVDNYSLAIASINKITEMEPSIVTMSELRASLA